MSEYLISTPNHSSTQALFWSESRIPVLIGSHLSIRSTRASMLRYSEQLGVGTYLQLRDLTWTVSCNGWRRTTQSLLVELWVSRAECVGSPRKPAQSDWSRKFLYLAPSSQMPTILRSCTICAWTTTQNMQA